MKHLLRIVSVAVIGSTTTTYLQDANQEPSSDLQSATQRAIEQGAPTETTGMTSSVLGAISLEAYLETLTGGEFRAREVVLAPGAEIGIHAHNHRPALVHVLEGELVEHRNDRETPMIRRQGDTYFEGPGVVHWLENVSSDPVRAFAVDIVPRNVE